MRLTQIKLSGFKSFVDPTAVQIPSQLVGIVGPNGCGKSNIIDAVRWVLGESKASELRGESMQDVIFNGSLNRKPAARASVELVFDNAEGKAAGQWSQYAEVSVKRVLTKEGQSNYLINNQQVRRRDIHDLFLGTGLGARGYAIIGQGMISRIIEARPEELRVFLEEAAGVSRYKERRRETENRLSDTRDNLVRVEDILRELDSQLTKLELQAQVATQYKALQQEGEKKLQTLWLIKKQTADQERLKFTKDIEALQLEQEQTTAELRKIESEVEKVKQTYYVSTDQVQQAQAKLYEANAEVTKLETEIKFVVESRARSHQQLDQLKKQQEQWLYQQTNYQEQLQDIHELVEESVIQVEEALISYEDRQAQLPELEEHFKEHTALVNTKRLGLSQLEQQLALCAQSQRDVSHQLQTLHVREERLRSELRQLDKPDEVRLAQIKGDLDETQQRLRDAQEQLLQLEQQVPQLEATRQTAQEGLGLEQAKAHQLDAKLQALCQLQDSVQAQTKITPWLVKHGLESISPLWKKMQIEPGWETALEAALRETLNAIELSDLSWAKGLAEDAPPARLCLYQLPDAQFDKARTSGFQPLVSLIHCQDLRLKQLLSSALGHIYMSSGLGVALSQRSELTQSECFVTKEGHLVTQDSVLFYAPDSEQSGVFARQQEIENLRRQVKAQNLIMDESRNASVRAESVFQSLMQTLPVARTRVNELTQRQHVLQMELTQLESLLNQSSHRAQQIETELQEFACQQEELRILQAELEAKFEQYDSQLADGQTEFEAFLDRLDTLTQQVQTVRDVIRSAERTHQERVFQQRSLQVKKEELERSLLMAQGQLAGLQEEIARVQAISTEFDDEAARCGLEDALELRAQREKELSQTRIEMDNLSARLRELDEHRLSCERSLEPVRQRNNELMLKEQATRLAQEQFSQQLEEHKVNVQQLQDELLSLPSEWQKSSWLQSEVHRVTAAVNALGAVNLAALEELQTAQERKSFLDAQQLDLNDAIETLEDAIRKIDKETRALLQETFNQVNQHFGELFPSLFGGGEAKLVMTGEEILDAGVQVMAQPPGKRNSTIHLLSGGEKALTATALVFAMFKLNPAPFCLLDEVDAPLDDANTERYARLVQRMSSHTQFLFISHNKIAMEIAHQLIGVTMQEQGVSRIVAVDIESAVKMATE